MSAPLYNIGPNAIGDPGTPGGPGFTLARPEWIAIQRYCTDLLALPTTDDAFRKSLGPGAPADLSDFQGLVEAYAMINRHVTAWTTTTFPDSLAVAGDIHLFGTSKAPVYYPPLLVEALLLERNPDDQDAKNALRSILDNLKADADGKSARAGAIAQEIGRFATETTADLVALVGSEETGGLITYYTSVYGTTSPEVAQLCHDVVDLREILKAANDAYDRDMIVASTPPAYAWVWPAGLVATAVADGAYGQSAVDALAASRATQARIDALPDPLAAAANLLVAMHSAEVGLEGIADAVGEALPVIQRIQGVWGGIAADLGVLSALIDTDVRSVPPIIRSLGVDDTTVAWRDVALTADVYRANAQLTERPGARSMAAWQVDTQFASTRVAA